VAKGIMVVEADPAGDERDAEFNEWYNETHIPEICAIPGFVAARRYKIRDSVQGPSAKPTYLAIYELEADDLSVPLEELAARRDGGRTTRSAALQMSPPPVVTVYELIE
jgi:hypothetical protein